MPKTKKKKLKYNN